MKKIFVTETHVSENSNVLGDLATLMVVNLIL